VARTERCQEVQFYLIAEIQYFNFGIFTSYANSFWAMGLKAGHFLTHLYITELITQIVEPNVTAGRVGQTYSFRDSQAQLISYETNNGCSSYGGGGGGKAEN
jgi:hypothetical protein